MGQVVWTKRATRELNSLHVYFGEFSPRYAQSLVAELTKRARLLERLPRMSRVVPEFQVKAIRELIVDRYRVLYLLDHEDCTVLAVIDGRRDMSQMFDPMSVSP